MFVLIVGCGRVGSAVARKMLAERHEVSVLDEDPEAIAQLEKGADEDWVDAGGSFTKIVRLMTFSKLVPASFRIVPMFSIVRRACSAGSGE